MKRLAAGLFAATLVFGAMSGVRAQEVSPAPLPPPADCSAVGLDDASRILGYAVDGPDDNSRAGGICFFSARALSDEGSVSYAVVTNAELPERRGFFAALVRRCGSVAHGAPRELVCAAYVKLALAGDLDAYFAARTGWSDGSPVPGLGGTAIATEDALYVRCPDSVVEAVVRRGQDFDLARSTELAKLVIARRRPER